MGRVNLIIVVACAALLLLVQAGRSVNAATPGGQRWQYAEIIREYGHYTIQDTFFAGGCMRRLSRTKT